ncbi:MAG: tyrosine-type recombinase/integrase [Methanocorpusculum sp.]|nr:tyrosine-type recombinase/integrase [Methanocorpusculum sp.]
MLDTFCAQGNWVKGRALQPQPLPLNFVDFLNAQDAALVKRAYSQCSRETVREFCERFMRFLVDQNIEALSQLTYTHISNYLLQFNGHAKSTVRCELSRLRQTLKSMYLLQYTTDNLATYIPLYHFGQADSMAKIWKSDELARLVDTVDNASAKGKRDMAYIMFASELGMRSTDIRNLKLSDIDWEKCCVTFVQSKTGKLNNLPLSEKLGLAIIDYMRMRPQTGSSFLFVNLTPPYGQMARFNGEFQRYVRRAGIHVEPQAHHGLHSLRATLATRLTENDVAADVIAPFLGHSDEHSLHRYIKLDIENLRKCALSFEDGELI